MFNYIRSVWGVVRSVFGMVSQNPGNVAVVAAVVCVGAFVVVTSGGLTSALATGANLIGLNLVNVGNITQILTSAEMLSGGIALLELINYVGAQNRQHDNELAAIQKKEINEDESNSGTIQVHVQSSQLELSNLKKLMSEMQVNFLELQQRTLQDEQRIEALNQCVDQVKQDQVKFNRVIIKKHEELADQQDTIVTQLSRVGLMGRSNLFTSQRVSLQSHNAAVSDSSIVRQRAPQKDVNDDCDPDKMKPNRPGAGFPNSGGLQ